VDFPAIEGSQISGIHGRRFAFGESNGSYVFGSYVFGSYVVLI
jgi:hypothetical protein